jgi:hypothetical protein
MLLIFSQKQHFSVFHFESIDAGHYDSSCFVCLCDGERSFVRPDRFCVHCSVSMMLAEHFEDFIASNGKEPRPKDTGIGQCPHVVIHLEERIVRCVFSEGSITCQLQTEGKYVALVAMVEFFERVHVAASHHLNKQFLSLEFQWGAFVVLTAALICHKTYKEAKSCCALRRLWSQLSLTTHLEGIRTLQMEALNSYATIVLIAEVKETEETR